MKLFKSLLLVSLSVFPVLANAQYVESTGASEEHIVVAYLDEDIRSMLRHASQEERRIAASIKVVVVPFHPADFIITPQAAISKEGERLIILSDAFLLFLDGYLETYLLGEFIGDDFIAERWAQRHLAQVSMVNQSPMVLPGQFASLNSDEISRFRETTSDIFSGLKWFVLTDILLHEICHHTTNSFYNPNFDSSAEMIAAEAAADQCASEVFEEFAQDQERILDKSNSVGRAFALLALREINAFVSTRDVRVSDTHPTPASRVRYVLYNGACTQREQIIDMEELCGKLRDVVRSLETEDRGYATYFDRAQDGEAFATFRLGQVLLGEGKINEACLQFEEAYKRGMRGWNTRYLAWCYEPESSTGFSDAKLAEEFYYQAADDGWAEAQSWVRKFGTR